MSTLKTTNIQHPSSSVENFKLAADGTVEVYDGSAWVNVAFPLGTATPVDGSVLSYSTATSTYDPTASAMPIAVAFGTIAATTYGGSSHNKVTVTFPAGRFSSAPFVLISPIGTGDSYWVGRFLVSADSITSSQFVAEFNIGTSNTYAIGATWMAVEF